MSATLTERLSGMAWSEDPDGIDLHQIRVDFNASGGAPAELAASMSVRLPRRGPLKLSQVGQAAMLSDVRDYVLAAEQVLAGPVTLRWYVGADGVEVADQRLLDQPLPWGAAPGRGFSVTPNSNDRWSRANAGEVIPNVMTPLSWSVISGALERGFQEPWGDWTAGRRFVALFDGYVYFNVGLMLELMEQRLGLPSAHFLEAVGGPEDPGAGTSQIHWSLVLRRLPFIFRSLGAQRGLAQRWPSQRAAAEAERDRLRALPVSELSDANILRELNRSAAQAERLVIFLMESQTAVFSAVQGLLWSVDRWLGADQRQLALSVLQGLQGVRTQEGNIALRRIAERASDDQAATQFIQTHAAESIWPALQDDHLALALHWLRDAISDFLSEYGHRAAGELEAAEPRWVERPELILSTFRDYVLESDSEPSDAMIARQHDARLRAEGEIQQRLLAQPFGWLRWPIVKSQIEQTQAMQPLRENPKFTLLELSLQQRRLWQTLAERWLERDLIDQLDDVYYLHLEELAILTRRGADAVVANRMRNRIRRRRRQFDSWTKQRAAPLRDDRGNPLAEAPQVEPSETLPFNLKGIAAASGLAEGRAHVADTAEVGRQLTPGQILVARFTDPGWTPIFPLAAAVVTEIGGVLSHGAIVAREFGIPAVVNVPTVTSRIRSGDLLRVDGGSGQVTILERA